MFSVFDMGVKIRPSMYVKVVLYQTNSNHWSSKAPSTAAPMVKQDSNNLDNTQKIDEGGRAHREIWLQKVSFL